MEELILKYLNSRFPGEISYYPDMTFICLKVDGMDVGLFHTSKKEFLFHVRLYNDIRVWFQGVPNYVIREAITRFLSPKLGPNIKTQEDIRKHIIKQLS
jgi:hypothetical protein